MGLWCRWLCCCWEPEDEPPPPKSDDNDTVKVEEVTPATPAVVCTTGDDSNPVSVPNSGVIREYPPSRPGSAAFRDSRPASAVDPPWGGLPPSFPLPPALGGHDGNPQYSPRKQLYCRTGFNLAIYPDGHVKGTSELYNYYAILEFSSVDVGEVRIRGLGSGFYLAMNRKGRLYGEIYPEEEGTIFVESVAGMYNSYLSRKYAHHGWYIAVKRSGKVKAGQKTMWGQKSTQFLPRPARPPSTTIPYGIRRY